MKRLIITSFLLAAICAGASAQVLLTGAGQAVLGSDGGGGGQSVWNPSDKNAAVSLSTTTVTNDTATTNTGSWVSVRGTKSYSTGTADKVVFAQTGSGVNSGEAWILGLADSTMSLSSYLGATGVSLGFQSNTGGGCAGDCSYSNGGVTIQSSGECQLISNSQAVYLAINFNNGHVFCSVGDCSSWANSGNPDSDTGYVATLAGSTTYFAAWAGEDYSGSAPMSVLNTAPSLGGCTNVSTFSQWG